MARFHGNTDNNAVTDYTGSSRYSAAVPPALTDDRSGFPGNGGFIHASDAFYHLSIQGDDIPGLAQHFVPFAQFGNGDDFLRSLVRQQTGVHINAHFFQSVRIRLSPALRQRFRKVGEKHGEPEPERDLQSKAEGLPGSQIPDKGNRCHQSAGSRDKHHEVFRQDARVKFAQRIPESCFQHGSVIPGLTLFLLHDHKHPDYRRIRLKAWFPNTRANAPE